MLNFAQITPTVRRVGLTVPVSNMAIDNAAFDLMAFVQTKFGIALREYIAKKIYSLAKWDGNKGPFPTRRLPLQTSSLVMLQEHPQAVG